MIDYLYFFYYKNFLKHFKIFLRNSYINNNNYIKMYSLQIIYLLFYYINVKFHLLLILCKCLIYSLIIPLVNLF